MSFTKGLPKRVGLFGCCAVLVFVSTAALWAQDTPPPDLKPQETKPPEISAEQLVRETVAHEVAAANETSIKQMFRSRRQTPKGSQTRLYVETKDSMAGMLIAINDQPLSTQQREAEIGHLNWLASSPDQLRKKRAREKEDADRMLRILKALPDAFRYEYLAHESGAANLGKAGDELVRLKFTANPAYNPPSRIESALEGMQGYLLIDASEKRIAKIDGTLFRDVSFGWGIIGKLDKGGRFVVQQADVGEGCWEITSMSLKITGKILMFKGISMISDEVFSDFQRVPPDLTFAKAVEMLKTEQEKPAPNSGDRVASENHQ